MDRSLNINPYLNNKHLMNYTMKYAFIILLLILPFGSILSQQTDPFPLIDLHVHIKGDLTIDSAIKKSRKDHIQYGIVVNCGMGFPVHTDMQVDSFLLAMKKYRQSFIGM